jgi:hypothetical protein
MFLHDKPFCEGIFSKVFKIQVYHFPCHLVQIKGLRAKGLHFFDIFFIFSNYLQNGVKMAGISIHSKDLNLSTPSVAIA